MNRADVDLVLKRHITNEIVVASFTCAFNWLAQGERALNYFSYGAMGLGSSHGLGLALARPERKVVVLEGDGSLLMNLGTLVTIAAQAPKNLIFFNFQNNTYDANGGHPIPRGEVLDFCGIARSCGIKRVFSIYDIAEFERQLPEILRANGPTFVTLHIEPGGGPPLRGYEQLYLETRREALRAELARAI
jgi:thiamine pyrophosphate-dependent acetolactate synthase large subunit-like protein